MQLPKQFITERLIWRANYSDGTNLWERDPKSHKENLFKDIDMNRIASFDLLKPMDDVDEALMGETEVRVESMLHKGMPAMITLKVYHKEQQPFLHVDLPKPKRLIFVRKKRITTGRDIANVLMGGTKGKDGKVTGGKTIQVPFPALETKEKVLIVIGWQETIHGKNIQAINYIYPSGMIELGGEFTKDAIHSQPAISPQNKATMQALADAGELNDDEIKKYELNTNKQEKK